MFSKMLQSYLRFWASRYLKRVKPKIIAVTGSVGKTATKSAIFEVLRAKFGNEVRESEGNLNNETGVPLAILGYQKSPEKFWQWLPIKLSAPLRIFANSKTKILVLEMAADKPGDIQYLTSFIKPNIAVLTSIGPAHLAAFGDIGKVIEEKTELLRALPDDSWAVLNYDDENLRKLNLDIPNLKTFAIDERADIIAQNITTEIVDFKPITKFQIAMDKVKFLAETKTLGRQTNIYPALIATAIGNILNLSPQQILDGLKNIRPEKHRMEVFKGKTGSIILDDCYNANPLSMRAALDTLKVLPAKRKIAVLGDMLELGEISREAHQLIGQYAKEIADEMLAVGDLAINYQVQKYFKNKEEATDYLLKETREGDMILIKASRALALEDIVEALRANP